MNITPRRAAALSIGTNTALVAAKLAAGLMTGSISVLSEAVHSGMDLLASVIAFFGVSVSARPADADHQYGHGKYENVSGLAEAALILAAAALIGVEAVRRILSGGRVEQTGPALAVMALSVGVNLVVSRVLFAVAKKHDSIALEADAHHLSTDVLTSVGVFGGLLLVRFTHIHVLDAVSAACVAALIAWVGADVLRRSLLDLMDRSLPQQEEARIRSIIEDHGEQFVEYHHVRTRKSGPEKHLDLHLVFCRRASVKHAHDIVDHIEGEMRDRIGRIQATTHLEPCGEDDSKCKDCPRQPAGNMQ